MGQQAVRQWEQSQLVCLIREVLEECSSLINIELLRWKVILQARWLPPLLLVLPLAITVCYAT